MEYINVLEQIIISGCDLEIRTPQDDDHMRRLAALAKEYKVHISMPVDMNQDLVIELCREYGEMITFISNPV